MRLQHLTLLMTLATMACAGDSRTDADGDGVTADVDCDDLNASAGVASVWYADSDGDGWGDEAAGTQTACTRPAEYALRRGDCDDTEAGVSPGAEESCNDRDDDCDGFIDEATDKGVWFADSDGDGFGDPENATERCDGSGGFVSNDLDCDDSVAAVKPGAEEKCDGIDNDCDARVDESDAVDATAWYLDSDGDNFGRTATQVISCNAPSSSWVDAGADCNDGDPVVNPAAEEKCDGFDNNCDGKADDASAVDALTWYQDDDGDTWGDPDGAIRSCRQPDGYISRGEDCNDRNRFLSPDTLWFADSDGDSYGTPDTTVASCLDPTAGTDVYVDNARDCDDAVDTVNPDATEVCDGIDNDCDGSADGGDAIDAETYFMDFDDDGFGDPGRTGRACSKPDGFTTDDSDCDDDNGDVYPGADEFCDGVDNDCDSLIDYADPDVIVLTWYRDADEDDYGDASISTASCEQPVGYVKDDTDCDDTDYLVNPGATEVCDAGLDNDCDGLVDSADPDMAGDGTWYRDSDGDGYGDDSITVTTCSEPSGYVRNPDDCDDADSTKWNTCWAGPRNFTNCSKTGQDGPAQSACDTAYGSTTLSGEVTVTGGKQKWEVPQDGTYEIEAWGAQGYSSQSGQVGGKGARMRGEFSLDKGDVIYIAVGHYGYGGGCSGGGGGGSFVVDDSNDAMIIAGGGGGTRTSVSQDGCDGRTTEYGGTGSNSGATWGCGAKSSGLGVGGIVSGGSWGSGGGGMTGNGASDSSGGSNSGGKSWTNGLKGGGDGSYTDHGGFGAGGGGNGSCGGGGGGGYSGGDGGRLGGGGGSYNDGSDPSNSAGVQSSHGKITIDWLGK